MARTFRYGAKKKSRTRQQKKRAVKSYVKKTMYPRFRPSHPVKRYVKLKYCQEFTLNPGAGTVASHAFKADDMYDPDHTGVGHQPMGFDQLTPIYQKHSVVASKATFIFSNEDSFAVVVGKKLDNDSTIGSSLPSITEQPNTSFKVLTARDGGRHVGRVVSKWSRKKQIPQSANSYNYVVNSSGATVKAIDWFHVAWTRALSASTDASTMHCYVVLTYWAIMFDREDLAQS